MHLPTSGLTWLALVFMGVLTSGLGFTVFYWLISSVGPSRAQLVGYSMPVVGVFLGVLALGERFTWNLGVGSAVLLLGIRLFGR